MFYSILFVLLLLLSYFYFDLHSSALPSIFGYLPYLPIFPPLARIFDSPWGGKVLISLLLPSVFDCLLFYLSLYLSIYLSPSLSCTLCCTSSSLPNPQINQPGWFLFLSSSSSSFFHPSSNSIYLLPSLLLLFDKYISPSHWKTKINGNNEMERFQYNTLQNNNNIVLIQ